MSRGYLKFFSFLRSRQQNAFIATEFIRKGKCDKLPAIFFSKIKNYCHIKAHVYENFNPKYKLYIIQDLLK
ncbi:5804_t:CDS:2 [Gigaspora rosea]|nr:5804_t:CDS:2 [Gigaspora rosea]